MANEPGRAQKRCDVPRRTRREDERVRTRDVRDGDRGVVPADRDREQTQEPEEVGVRRVEEEARAELRVDGALADDDGHRLGVPAEPWSLLEEVTW